MSELRANVALIALRAQADQIAAVIAQQLGVPVSIDVEGGVVLVHVGCRRRSDGLERAALALFVEVTVGLGSVSCEVSSGPRLRVVPPV